jgi:transposase
MAIKGKSESDVPKKGHWIGTYEADCQVRAIIADMLETARNNGKDRAQVAKEMTDKLGRPVTPVMLAEFTRSATELKKQNAEKPSRRKRYLSLPTPWVPALSAATGSDKLVRHLMDPQNRELLELAERQHLKFGWALQRLERLYSKIQEKKAGTAQKSERRKRTTNRAR